MREHSSKKFAPDELGLVEQEDELGKYIFELHCSAAEAQMAYEQALGIPLEESVREEVYQLAQKIDLLMKNGLPANRIAEVIDKVRMFESSPNVLSSLIEKLDVSERERSVLRSIIEQKREGKLTVYDRVKGNELLILTIRRGKEIVSDDVYKRLAAYKLISMLSKYQGQKIEIMFAEK